MSRAVRNALRHPKHPRKAGLDDTEPMGTPSEGQGASSPSQTAPDTCGQASQLYTRLKTLEFSLLYHHGEQNAPGSSSCSTLKYVCVSERPDYFNSYLEIFLIFRQQAINSWSEWLFPLLLIPVLRLLILWQTLWKGFFFLTGDSGTSEAFISICLCFLKTQQWSICNC